MEPEPNHLTKSPGVKAAQAVGRPAHPPEADSGGPKAKRGLSDFEQSTIRWAKVAVFMSLLAAIFVCFQWLEMRQGGVDTHSLAQAAADQATWTQRLATSTGIQADRTRDLADRMKDQAERTKTIAEQAVVQANAAKVSAEAARSAAKTASNQLILAERPWIKIKHRIVSPLTFDVGGRMGGPAAMMTLEDTIENVGQSVAVNVRHWEEIIPLYPDFPSRPNSPSAKTARARQEEYCNSNRHPQGLPGYTLFPHEPSVFQSEIGVPMSKVMAAVVHDEPGEKPPELKELSDLSLLAASFIGLLSSLRTVQPIRRDSSIT